MKVEVKSKEFFTHKNVYQVNFYDASYILTLLRYAHNLIVITSAKI